MTSSVKQGGRANGRRNKEAHGGVNVSAQIHACGFSLESRVLNMAR